MTVGHRGAVPPPGDDAGCGTGRGRGSHAARGGWPLRGLWAGGVFSGEVGTVGESRPLTHVCNFIFLIWIFVTNLDLVLAVIRTSS